MPWLKASDTAATHPRVMSLAADPKAEPWTVNEVFGFVVRCATQSAGHMTDYYVDLGTAMMLGGGRHELLLKQASRAGLVIPTGRGRDRRWKLVDDPEFLHLRLREEVEVERQRKRDNSNLELIIPVRLRDGDNCRYCHAAVNWADRKTGRGGTYDHLTYPATVDTLVVCCLSCNSGRKTDENQAEKYELKPVPAAPYYSPSTLKWLAKHGATIPTAPPAVPGATQHPTGHRASRPSTQPDTASTTVATPHPTGHRETASPAVPGATQHPAGHRASRPGTQPDTASTTVATPHAAGSRESAPPADPPARRPPWQDHDQAPPPWAEPATSPDLTDIKQISLDPGRQRGFGPGRVGTGSGHGSGADRSPPPPSPPSLQPSSTSSTQRRRARRKKR